MSKVAPLFLVVMAGGSGTRFWPKSTSKTPKQLLSFGATSSESLLNLTLKRFDGLVPTGATHRMIVTTQLLQSAVQEQVADGADVLAEPMGRNTAPCVYWAARAVYARDPKGIMLVMPSDHYIARLAEFKETVQRAADWAATHDDLVTLGVKPSRPETGYGYLKLGGENGSGAGAGGGSVGALGAGASAGASAGRRASDESSGCRKVEAFVEKPNLVKAREFVESGQYLWNGGMFLWRAEVILKAFDQWMPEMKAQWESNGGQVDRAYPHLPATSIDYGIMEKAQNVVTFTLDCGWDDLGSWTSLESLADVLQARQVSGTVTNGDIISVDSTGNIVDVPGKLVALLGVQDLIVVQQGESLLIAQKDRAQDIKLIVEEVKKKRPELA